MNSQFNAPMTRIDSLDLSLFESVPTQTSDGDRRSLLAIQRAVAKRYKEYRYLEIGSFLGGTLQPHLIDPRCQRIDSIDLRPDLSPDARAENCKLVYQDNSEEQMLKRLENLPGGDLAKLVCHRCDARNLDTDSVPSPHIAFIDGEHTREAVVSDFSVCHGLLGDGGVIAFHDCHLIGPAIREILDQLRDTGVRHLGLDLEGEIYAIFFDPRLVRSDDYLAGFAQKARRLRLCRFVKSILPGFFVKQIQRSK